MNLIQTIGKFKRLSFFVRRPRKVEFVIFYKDRSELLNKYIFRPLNTSTYAIEPSEINIHYQILIRFLFNIFVNLSLIRSRGLFNIYLESYISCFNPKGIITLIDDCSVFSRLSKHCTNQNFFAIQNGSRTIWQLRDFPQLLYVSNFFCFGQHVLDLYKKYHKTIENPILTGSFISGIFREENLEKTILDRDICIVSEITDSFFSYGNKSQIEQNYYINLDRLYKFLHKFIVKRALKVTVAGRGISNEEKEYFENLFGKKSYVHRTEFSSYYEMSRSKLIIGCCSTLLVESMSFNKKVLFYDPDIRDSFASSVKDGIWIIKSKKFTEFENDLNSILKINIKEYKKLTKEYFNYRMVNKIIPAHKIIQNEIKKLL